MPNDNTHTLLPCPFCQGPAEMVRRSGADYGINEYRVVCGGCGIGTEYVPNGSYKPKRAGGRHEWCANDARGRLIQIWNTRTPAEPKAGDWEEWAEEEILAMSNRISVAHEETGEGEAGNYVYSEDVMHIVSGAVSRALSSAAPRITENQDDK